MKLTISVGTRPQLIKISPLIRKIKHNFQFLDTGQHYDYELNKTFYEELNLPKPIFLNVGSGTPAEQTGKALIAIERELTEFRPDVLIVIGDTNSTLAGALAAVKQHLRVAHIEAGLRSFDRSMPEEINRIVVDHISDILFAPTENAVKNLMNEGIARERIHFTYDITVDACLESCGIAKKSRILEKLGLKSHQYVLVTAHRQGNVDNKEQLERIVDALIALDEPVVFPLHPRTLKNLEKFNFLRRLKEKAIITKPLGYFDFLRLLAESSCVITDSGGVQKEALILKTPCVTIRDSTEWTETLENGCNVLVGTDKKRIIEEVDKRLSGEFHKFMKDVKNPYGDGRASDRIIRVLNALFT